MSLGRSAGVTLDQIARMLGADDTLDLRRDMLTAKAEDWSEALPGCAMLDSLLHAALCPAPSCLDCPTLLRILRAAANGAFDRS